MSKAALIVFADTESAEGLGRVVNALTTAKEFREAGDEVQVVFDGAGTKWVAELSNSEHEYHELLADTRDLVAGACAYCSKAFGVLDEVEQSPVSLLDEYEGHPSIRKLVDQGFHVVTF